MNPPWEADAEEERRRRDANTLVLQVGLALIDDARRGGGFEVEEAKLTARLDELLEELRGADADPGATVEARPLDRERIELSVSTSASSSDGILLRVDGILLEEYSTFGVGFDSGQLSPAEQEAPLEAGPRLPATPDQRPPVGDVFLRALVPDPQPGSDFQLLAAELFANGLVVHFSFDRPPEGRAVPAAADGPPGLPAWLSAIQVEDDLGTRYLPGNGQGGGLQVIHGSRSFSPAVPAGARRLRINGPGGGIDLPL